MAARICMCTIENMLGMKLSYMFELTSEICCASTSLPCATFELQRKCRLLGSEFCTFIVANVLGIDFLSLIKV